MWIQNVIYATISYGLIHFIISCIRGFYRYGMIEKYHYDYYDTHPKSFIRKIGHNLIHSFISATTFYVSISLLAFFYFVFHAMKQI